MATVFESAPKKKRPRMGPSYQMEISFPKEDLKKTFLSRLDNARSSLSSSGSRNVDNYRLLSSLLDHFEEALPSTTSPAQRKPILKQSGNGGGYVYAMVYCNQGSIYWGGGGGEASTPSTTSSPPKHNYELIIIHVFVSF